MIVRESTFDEGICVVEAEGRLDAAAASLLEADLMSLLAEGKSKIVVDLGGVSYISSTGLRVLLVTIKRARGGGGDLKLCCLSPRVYDIFRMAGFTTIFPIHDTEEAAVQGFRAAGDRRDST